MAASLVIRSFLPLISDKQMNFEEVGTDVLPLPMFPLHLVKELLKDSEKYFVNLPNVIQLEANIFVVGDLHGNIRDLVRILGTASPPPNNRFLFLGDYVDRGEYSTEVIILLLALAIEYPNYVTLLRGNHEFESVNSTYGFKEQVLALYGNSGVYESFNEVFSYMPIAAIIQNQTLCVHGGLSPLWKNLDQLNDIERALNPPSELLNDIMWSDPSSVTEGCIQSTRGNGCLFGFTFLNMFLTKNNLLRLVRAHECVRNGVRVGKDSKIITVFSTCNYKGEGSNQCGIIKITDDDNYQAFNLKLISILHRDNAIFNKIAYAHKKITSIMMGASLQPSNSFLFTPRGSQAGQVPRCASSLRKKTIGNIRKLSSQCVIIKPEPPVENPIKRRWSLGQNDAEEFVSYADDLNLKIKGDKNNSNMGNEPDKYCSSSFLVPE